MLLAAWPRSRVSGVSLPSAGVHVRLVAVELLRRAFEAG
jgi:hypothetical protein